MGATAQWLLAFFASAAALNMLPAIQLQEALMINRHDFLGMDYANNM